MGGADAPSRSLECTGKFLLLCGLRSHQLLQHNLTSLCMLCVHSTNWWWIGSQAQFVRSFVLFLSFAHSLIHSFILPANIGRGSVTCQTAGETDRDKVRMDLTCQGRRYRAKEREGGGLLVCILSRMVVVFTETRNQGKACIMGVGG